MNKNFESNVINKIFFFLWSEDKSKLYVYKILKDKVWTPELKEVVHNDILEKVRVDASEYAKVHVTPFLNGEKEEVFLATCVNHDKRHKKIIFNTIEAKVEEVKQEVVKKTRTVKAKAKAIEEVVKAKEEKLVAAVKKTKAKNTKAKK